MTEGHVISSSLNTQGKRRYRFTFSPCRLMLVILGGVAGFSQCYLFIWCNNEVDAYQDVSNAIFQPTKITSIANHKSTDMNRVCITSAAEENIADSKKVLRVLQAEKVLIHVMKKFQQNGAPIALGFGTALHALRKGPCFRPNLEDDDIDLMVFPYHFLSMFNNEMDRELRDLFGWSIWRPKRWNGGRAFLQIGPQEEGADSDVKKTSFQIDVYAMHCDVARGTISQTWDGFKFKLNDFLPFRKQMWDLSHVNETRSFYLVPRQNECFLENFYGQDFRVPQKKKHTERPVKGIYANEPRCEERVLGLSEQQEFMEQLLFCQGCKQRPCRY